MKEEKKQSFVNQVIAANNKDKSEVFAEKVADTVEDFVIETEAQIANIEVSELPALIAKKTRQERDLAKLEKTSNTVYLDVVDCSYEQYINKINNAEKKISELKSEMSSVDTEISTTKIKLEKFTNLLAKLKG